MADANNRYSGTPTAIYQAADGGKVVYYTRRVLPQPDSLTIVSDVVIGPNDRPDLVATRALGNPLLFWRIGDANYAMNPFALTAKSGERLNVPLPQPGPAA